MLLNVTLPQLLFLPPLLLVVSGLALFNFQTLFRFLSTSECSLNWGIICTRPFCLMRPLLYRPQGVHDHPGRAAPQAMYGLRCPLSEVGGVKRI